MAVRSFIAAGPHPANPGSMLTTVIIGLLAATGAGALALSKARDRVGIPAIVDRDHLIDGGGTACLAMVLAHHQRSADLDVLRRAVVLPEGGTSALRLIQVAEARGLKARGIKASPDGMGGVWRASILHFTDDTFVLLDHATRHTVHINDPARGRLRLSTAKFREKFSGVALMFDTRD
jgi:peptidase C39-like protein